MNKYIRSDKIAKKLLAISHKLHGDALHYFIGALSANLAHVIVNIDDYMSDNSKEIEDRIIEAYETSKDSSLKYAEKR